MTEQIFSEKDWQLFRSKIAGWQKNYMDRLNKEYIDLLSGDESPSKKFWQLNERVNEDREKAGVSVEMKRSKLIANILLLLDEGAINLDDLEEFSNELKERVSLLNSKGLFL